MLYRLSYGRAVARNDREGPTEGQAAFSTVLARRVRPVSAPIRAL